MEKLFSVIMPVTLSEYEGSSSNRAEKFKRAVKSFLGNIFPAAQAELIIVSDGCDESEQIYLQKFQKSNVKFFKMEKQPLFSGNVRQHGIDNAEGKYILYLDSDDVLGEMHLDTVRKALISAKEPAWTYFDDYIVKSFSSISLKSVSLKHGSVGTSSICHKRELNVSWVGCDGYGHDWTFIQKLMAINRMPIKSPTPYYFIHHIPSLVDC